MGDERRDAHDDLVDVLSYVTLCLNRCGPSREERMTPDEFDRREELDRRSPWDRFTVGQRVFVVREPGSLLRGEPVTGRVISFDRETVAVAETATMTSDDGHAVRFFPQKVVFVTYADWRDVVHRSNSRGAP